MTMTTVVSALMKTLHRYQLLIVPMNLMFWDQRSEVTCLLSTVLVTVTMNTFKREPFKIISFSIF